MSLKRHKNIDLPFCFIITQLDRLRIFIFFCIKHPMNSFLSRLESCGMKMYFLMDSSQSLSMFFLFLNILLHFFHVNSGINSTDLPVEECPDTCWLETSDLELKPSTQSSKNSAPHSHCLCSQMWGFAAFSFNYCKYLNLFWIALRFELLIGQNKHCKGVTQFGLWVIVTAFLNLYLTNSLLLKQ